MSRRRSEDRAMLWIDWFYTFIGLLLTAGLAVFYVLSHFNSNLLALCLIVMQQVVGRSAESYIENKKSKTGDHRRPDYKGLAKRIMIVRGILILAAVVIFFFNYDGSSPVLRFRLSP